MAAIDPSSTVRRRVSSGDSAVAALTPDAKELAELRENLASVLESIDAIDEGGDGSGSTRLVEVQQQAMDVQVGALSKLCRRIEATKAKVSAELEGMQCEVQQLMDRIRETRQSVGDADARDARLRTMWHEKTFRPRDSLLTEMLEGSEHFRTIYNIAVAVLLILFLQIIVTDWVEHGRFVDLSLFAWAFSGIGIVVPAWVAMSLTSLLVVPWVQLVHRHNWSWRVWLAPYVLVQLLLYTYSGYVCLSNGMAVPSALIVAVEQTRISLKMHAYLREKLLHGRAHETVTKALQWLRSQPKGTPPAESPAEATRQAQGEDDGGLSQFPFEVDPTSPAGYALWIPAWARRRGVTLLHVEPPAITIGDASTEIGRFLYFFFAPTLIYRDAYPRTSAKVDWLQAGVHMAEFLGVISYCYVILTTFISPYFAETPSNPGDLRSFVRSVFHSMAPGMMVLVLMFFGVLHVLFNLFAVCLRHADRRFYADWWSTTNWSDYYRKWNAVVGGALKTYLYHDAQRFSRGRISKGLALGLVFLISAFIHEYIIAIAVGFWFPALLVLFGGPGTFFMRLTNGNHSYNNIFMWAMLSAGMSLLLVLYSREWYARHADPPVVQPWQYGYITPFLPHSLFAYYEGLSS